MEAQPVQSAASPESRPWGPAPSLQASWATGPRIIHRHDGPSSRLQDTYGWQDALVFPRTCFLLSLPIMSDILPFSGVPPQKLLPLARCEGNPLGEARTPKSQPGNV